MRDPLRLLKRGSEYVAARAPVIRPVYWNLAPRYYHWKLQRLFAQQDAPLDPTKIVAVDPSRLNRMTGRLKSNVERSAAVGCVKDGEWDRTPRRDTMFDGRYFEDTVLHTSFYEHFKNGREWEETELYDRMRQDPEIQRKMGVHSKEDIVNRLDRYDRLYHQIDRLGYKTQHELRQENGLKSDRVGYLDMLTDEITVDIGRNGDLLFVDGNHRLSIVKLLELDSVPVVILVRHQQWLEKRERLYRMCKRGEVIPNHLDTVEFNE